MSTSNKSAFDRSEVLTKATIRAADALGLTSRQLSTALGLSPSTLSSTRSGVYSFQPNTTPWQRAVLLVRLWEGLDRALASDGQAVRAWMVNQNLELGGKPVDLIAQVSGCARVVAYVEGYNSRD